MNEFKAQQEEDGMKIVEPETGNFGYAEYLAKENYDVEQELQAKGDDEFFGFIKDFNAAFGYDDTPNKEPKAASAKELDFHGKFEEMDKWTQEQIINPKHYKDIVPGYEYMQMMEHVLGKDGVKAHLKGQIWKYLCRLGAKDSETQELGKIIWYAEYLKDYLEREANAQTPYNPETPRGE